MTQGQTTYPRPHSWEAVELGPDSGTPDLMLSSVCCFPVSFSPRHQPEIGIFWLLLLFSPLTGEQMGPESNASASMPRLGYTRAQVQARPMASGTHAFVWTSQWVFGFWGFDQVAQTLMDLNLLPKSFAFGSDSFSS